MVTLTKRNKIAIAAVAVAVALIVLVPFVSAQTTTADPLTSTKTLIARGNAYIKIDNETIKYYPANLTLTAQPTSTNSTIKKFDITGGTIMVNGVSYTITSGNGGVAVGRHLILLQAQGTGPDGQPVTLKLEGRYFWLWGQLYVARIGARLQTDNGNYTMLLRAGAKI